MSDKVVVASPNYVLVLRKGAKQFDVLASLAAVIIAGGKRRAGNGYSPGEPLGDKFSFGFEDPLGIGVMTRAGKKLKRSDVTRVAVCGGTEVPAADAERVISQILSPPPATVLGGEVPINLISNGATTEIADTELNAGRTSSGVFKDDFLDELHQRTKAQIGPNGELLDDFDTLYQLQKGVHEELSATAPFARTNPPSASNALLGGQVTCTAGGLPQRIAFWQANSDVECTSVTVTLGAAFSGLPPLAAQANYRPFANIQFGTRGFAMLAVVDINNGTQLTVGGSMVAVDVALAAPKASVGSPPAPIALTGMLSFTPTNKVISPTRTLYVDGLNQLASAVLNVPAFAKRFTVWRDPLNADFTIFMLQGAGGGNQYTVPVATNALLTTPIPIPGDVTIMLISNGNTAALNSVAVVFELDL